MPAARRRSVVRLARLASLALGAVLALAGVTAPTIALADPPARFRDLPPEQRRQIVRERFESLPPAEQDRIRDRIRYERQQGGGQLSPDQRRQLRQDIMHHGREVYGPRPHR